MSYKQKQVLSALIDYVFAIIVGGLSYFPISNGFSVNLSIAKFSLIYGPVVSLFINLLIAYNKIYFTYGMLTMRYKYVEKEHMRNKITWTYIMQTAYMIAFSSSIRNFALITFVTLILGSIVSLNYKDKQALVWNLFTDLTDFEEIFKSK